MNFWRLVECWSPDKLLIWEYHRLKLGLTKFFLRFSLISWERCSIPEMPLSRLLERLRILGGLKNMREVLDFFVVPQPVDESDLVLAEVEHF